MKNKRTYILIAVLTVLAVAVATLDACTPAPADEGEITVTIPVTIPVTTLPAPATTASPETTAETEAPAADLREEIRDAWEKAYADSLAAPDPHPDLTARRLETFTTFSCGLITGNGAAMAEALGVTPAVYACYDGIKIADWGVRMVTVDYYGNPRDLPVLDITVTESSASALPPGQHALVLDEGMYLTFCPLKTTLTVPTYTSIEQYIRDSLFNYGNCDFIVARLNALAGDDNPRTAAEIEEYARTCLDLDPAALNLEWELQPVEGGYVRIGRGGGSKVYTVVSEETRDGNTVVTVRFWADYSRTVEAKTVEYHLAETAIDWKLIKTVTVSDSGFAAASIST